jgi:hypothetical protein
VLTLQGGLGSAKRSTKGPQDLLHPVADHPRPIPLRYNLILGLPPFLKLSPLNRCGQRIIARNRQSFYRLNAPTQPSFPFSHSGVPKAADRVFDQLSPLQKIDPSTGDAAACIRGRWTTMQPSKRLSGGRRGGRGEWIPTRSAFSKMPNHSSTLPDCC